MKLLHFIIRSQFRGNPQIVLILRLSIVLFLLIASRLLLYYFNLNLFPTASTDLFYYAITGIRFDVVALVYANIPFIFLLSVPFRFRRKKAFIKTTNIIFYFVNAVLLLPNFIDIIYYRFTLKRLTSDIFNTFESQIDLTDLLPSFIHDFWFIPLMWIGFVIILIFLSSRIQISHRYVMQPNTSYYISQFVVFLLFMGASILGMRGGLQLKPLSTLHVSKYASTQNSALVLNSAFTLMRSSGQKGIKPMTFFTTDSEMKSFFSSEKNYSNTDSLGKVLPMQKPNIFIIILESFSIEHIGALNNQANKQSFTPFLDSLISKCITYNAYANGKRSIEGIPSIVSSLPSWMTSDFISSSYSGNRYSSIAGILKNEGYTSAFFHGGKNGTMGFDSYLIAGGFEKYYGKNEYPIASDFDNHWGIWDEPYMQYVAQSITNFRQPFCATVFTLSSHHPYNIPEKYKNKLKVGKLPIQQSIMYTDEALRLFFNKVTALPWFKNTLFVITADHTSEASIPYFQTTVGQYAIPILFYNFNDTSQFQTSATAQQTDIVPTLLDYIHYPKSFTAFGNSLLRSQEPHFSLAKTNPGFQIIQQNYCLQLDESLQPLALYDLTADSLQLSNLIKSETSQAIKMTNLAKSIIQQYNNKLINNKITSIQ